MTLDEFVTAFAEEFDETPAEQFKADTVYKKLDEWGSLTALSIVVWPWKTSARKLLVQTFALATPLRICTT